MRWDLIHFALTSLRHNHIAKRIRKVKRLPAFRVPRMMDIDYKAHR
jgi:hypothetical protein